MMSGFKVFTFRGIPVYFSIWFVAVTAYVAARSPSVFGGLIIAAAVLISLIVHEFGHALMARAFNLRPSVLLHSWGGLCAHASPRSARDDALIVAAGPVAGFIFGALIWGLVALLDGTVGGWSADLPYLSFLFDTLIDFNVYWSLINVLPVYPLDGGQLFQIYAYRTWPRPQAHTYVHYLGVAIAIVGIVWASGRNNTLLIVISAFIVVENIRQLQLGPSRFYNERTGGAPTVTQGAGWLGSLKPEPVVAKLMIALGAIWAFMVFGISVFEQAWATDVYTQLWLEPTEAIAGFKVWQLGTYAWLHDLADLGHILGNVFGLWFLGNVLARRWGAKDFLNFYLWSALGAGLFSVVMGHLFPGTFDNPIVGASGAIMAMLTAVSLTLGDQVLGMFFTIPVKAKYLLPAVMILDILMWLSKGSNLAIHTHFGGVLTGWLLMTGNWRPRLAIDRIRLWRIRRGKRKPAKDRAPHLRVIDGGAGKDRNKTDDDQWLH